MAYNVTGLTDYVNEQNFPLLRKTIMGAKTAGLISLQTGVKSSASLNIMDTAVVLQADGCTRSADGDTTFTERELKVAPIAVHQDFCPKDLEKKYTQSRVKAGSLQNEMPFEEEFTGLIAEKIAATLETAIWRGDAVSGAANLNRFDGFLKLIDAEVSVVDGNPTDITAITSVNVVAIVDGVYNAIPTALLGAEDLRIFMGMDTFRLYTMALKSANLFHYSADSTNFEITVPGTNVTVVAVNGLNSTSRIIAARTSNLYLGVDLEGEEDNFEMWYSQDDRKVKFTAAFKYGVQFAFPDEIVSYKNHA
jgi:hypothetical protein